MRHKFSLGKRFISIISFLAPQMGRRLQKIYAWRALIAISLKAAEGGLLTHELAR
jgi:hypothetical protein